MRSSAAAFRKQEPLPDFSSVFEVESYLRYRGSQFVDRFDANSYLYITKAMDLFDVTNGHASLAAALERTQSRFLVISFTSDWLYPTYQSLEIVSALAGPQSRRCVLRTAIELRPRCVSGRCRRADGIDSRLSCQHVSREGGESLMSAAAVELKHPSVRDVLGRSDYAIISQLVEPNTRVLDVGCGEGELLHWLALHKGVDARGVEIVGVEGAARDCARRFGLSGRHRSGLADYPDQAFDYVILSQTLQEVRKPLQGPDGDAARRPARDRRLSEFRPLDACGWLICGRAARRGRSCSRTTGTIRRISTS